MAAYCAGAYLQVTAPTSLSYPSLNISATKGVPYTEAAPSYNGDTGTFSVSPALPAGLSIDPTTGIVSGTPTVLAVTNVNHVVSVTNAGGSTSIIRQVRVRDVAPSNLVYPVVSQTYLANEAITDNVPTISGGPVTSWSVSPSLPAGLGLRQADGAIFGLPTQSSSLTSYTVTATNSGGSTTAQISIGVQLAAPENLSYAVQSPSYTVNVPITANSPTISGGPVSTWSISPSLPEGLSLNASTGVITGTPTAASPATNYTVTATNSGGSTSTTLYMVVTIQAPSGFSYSASSYTFRNAQQIAQLSPTITGTVTGYSVSPSLPTGLSLDIVTGAITGKPLGVFPGNDYTVTATNSGGSVSVTLQITVNDVPPAGLTYTRMYPTYLVGQAIAPNPPSVSGGAVTSWLMVPSLPAGMSFNTSTGVISGTATNVSAGQSYTVTATNSGGSTQTTINLSVVAEGPQVIVPETYVSGTKATLEIDRANLSALSVVAANPQFENQELWQKIHALWVNNEVPVGDTNRVTGATFRGNTDMLAKFKASAEAGTYEIRSIYVVKDDGEILKIRRSDLVSAISLDIPVA